MKKKLMKMFEVNAYPENNIGLKGWKAISVTEARWPRSTATGSGGGLLLIILLIYGSFSVAGFFAEVRSTWEFHCAA